MSLPRPRHPTGGQKGASNRCPGRLRRLGERQARPRPVCRGRRRWQPNPRQRPPRLFPLPTCRQRPLRLDREL